MFPTILPIKSPEFLRRVAKAMQEDKHIPVYPSHAVMKGGEIIGSLAVCSAPITVFWMDSNKADSRDSLFAEAMAESLTAARGFDDVFTVCWQGSPFSKHMEGKLGFQPLWHTTLYYKSFERQ